MEAFTRRLVIIAGSMLLNAGGLAAVASTGLTAHELLRIGGVSALLWGLVLILITILS